jgi:hypothetical protein
MNLGLIRPDWPAPPNIHAVTTTRQGGVSQAPFDSLNLAGHVGDQSAAVAANRARLADALSLFDGPLLEEPHWLSQVHGVGVVSLDESQEGLPEADASITSQPGRVCAVLTADCLPVLFCDRDGAQVAAAHAGWRGLAAGVLEATVASFVAPPDQIMVWLGPAIGPQAFEVGDEVRATFLATDPQTAECFVENGPGCWCADLYQLARQRLAQVGVNAVYGGGRCTFTEVDSFFSFRRDGNTGRMASLIWIEAGKK